MFGEFVLFDNKTVFLAGFSVEVSSEGNLGDLILPFEPWRPCYISDLTIDLL
jgi:hypothetical protein